MEMDDSQVTVDVHQALHIMDIKGFHLEIKPLNNNHTKENIYSNVIVTKDLEVIEVDRDTFMKAYNQLWLERLRLERNKRIKQTDYLATIDAPLTTPEKKQEWLDYRQALRDLPSVTEDPLNPVWPTIPTA
jgi:hypothetical protein